MKPHNKFHRILSFINCRAVSIHTKNTIISSSNVWWKPRETTSDASSLIENQMKWKFLFIQKLFRATSYGYGQWMPQTPKDFFSFIQLYRISLELNVKSSPYRRIHMYQNIRIKVPARMCVIFNKNIWYE